MTHQGDRLTLDIAYLVCSDCATLMCYEDIKVSFIVESELVRQGNWERAESGSRKGNARDFRRV